MTQPAPQANLHALLTYRDAHSARVEGLHAGGVAALEKPDLQLDQAALRLDNDHVVLAAAPDAPSATLEATLTLLELPTNWRPYATLALHLTNGPTPVTVTLTVLGARCRLSQSIDLPPNATATLPLDLTDLPLTAGIRALYSPNAVEIRLTSTEPAPHITLHSLELTGKATHAPVVDPFGQRRSTTWPTKVRTLEDLHTHRNNEPATLAANFPPHPHRDPFGGWTQGPRFTPTGFFRVDQDPQGKWWLVTPLGNPFFSVGVTGIRLTDNTPYASREHLFEALPDPAGPHASAYIPAGGGVSFYRWNVLRKYTTPEAWRDRVLLRMKHLGLNTAACWSEDLILNSGVPHVRFFRARVDQLPPASRRFPDVFDPAWERLVDALAADTIAPHHNNPNLIGTFVDNEMPWRKMNLLDAEGAAPLRDAFLAFLHERYPSLDALNAAWQSHFRTWMDLRNLSASQFPADNPAAADTMADFEALYARRYFATVRRIVKKHAPNHLYLGCRFVRIPPADRIVAIAGEYCDVLSVNCYSLTPDPAAFTRWHTLSGGKPIIIGEHHLALASNRQLPPLYRAFTAEERLRYYAEFVHTWADLPFAVGCHWFQHADQPLTGRFQDGEDQLIGLVDITDQPHQDLAHSIHTATATMYQRHNQAK